MIRRVCSKCQETAYGPKNSTLCASCDGLLGRLEFDGLEIEVYRDTTGAIKIHLDTSSLEWKDEHPIYGVPKLRLQVNDGPTEQMNADGDWVQGDGYPDSTVLDHLAAVVDDPVDVD